VDDLIEQSEDQVHLTILEEQ